MFIQPSPFKELHQQTQLAAATRTHDGLSSSNGIGQTQLLPLQRLSRQAATRRQLRAWRSLGEEIPGAVWFPFLFVCMLLEKRHLLLSSFLTVWRGGKPKTPISSRVLSVHSSLLVPHIYIYIYIYTRQPTEALYTTYLICKYMYIYIYIYIYIPTVVCSPCCMVVLTSLTKRQRLEEMRAEGDIFIIKKNMKTSARR